MEFELSVCSFAQGHSSDGKHMCMLCNIILLVSFLAFEDLLLILHLGMLLAYHRQVVEAGCNLDATLCSCHHPHRLFCNVIHV